MISSFILLKKKKKKKQCFLTLVYEAIYELACLFELILHNAVPFYYIPAILTFFCYSNMPSSFSVTLTCQTLTLAISSV